MRPTIILAGLALAVLVAGALTLILANTESAPVADPQRKPLESVAFPTSGSGGARPRAATLSGSRSASSAVAPSPTGAAAAPGRVEPGRTARAARAAILAAKQQHLPTARQSPAPATATAWESLPPEEVAAMEARGMDWRKLEEMLRGGGPGEAAAAVGEQPLEVEGSDGAE